MEHAYTLSMQHASTSAEGPRTIRDPLNSAFLDTEVLHRTLEPCAPHSNFGTDSEMMRSKLLCSNRRVVPLGRERGHPLVGVTRGTSPLNFRDSSGSHCPLHGSQHATLRPGTSGSDGARTHSHHNTPACARAPRPSHTPVLGRVPPSACTPQGSTTGDPVDLYPVDLYPVDLL
jgi:hypothetical protein